MPQPRKYATHAERQQAYRQRQAREHARLTTRAQRFTRKQDARLHARYTLGTTAALLLRDAPPALLLRDAPPALLLRDAPPALLAWALDQIETGQYDKEWLAHGAPGPRFRRLIDYVYDVQAGRPLYMLFQGQPHEVAQRLEPESVDVIITDLSPTRGR